MDWFGNLYKWMMFIDKFQVLKKLIWSIHSKHFNISRVKQAATKEFNNILTSACTKACSTSWFFPQACLGLEGNNEDH